jgi:hypothetical protein
MASLPARFKNLYHLLGEHEGKAHLLILQKPAEVQ